MSTERFQAIAIGGSAGSLDALSQILPALPADFALPIFVVVHLPPDKKSVLAEVLQAKCELQVREAQDKEPIEAGTIYLAPPDYHLLVETDRRLSLSFDEPQMYSRPSIDVLFESAADAYGRALIGVILSGANADGAQGLRKVTDEGGAAFVQSPETALSDTMPLAALQHCPGARALPPPSIAQSLSRRSHDEL